MQRLMGYLWILLALQGALLACKLGGRLDWSWLWILCPWWMPALLLAMAFAVLASMAGLLWLCRRGLQWLERMMPMDRNPGDAP